MMQQITEGKSISPVQFLTVGGKEHVPAPLIRITICGLLTVEIAEEIVSLDPPLVHYTSLTPEQLRGRGTVPAFTLLKLLLNRHERFASHEWLMEQFCCEGELFSSKRINNIVSQLRNVLCSSALPVMQALRMQTVAHVRSSGGNGGYQLAAYPLIWVDQDALAWNVEQATRMERFNDPALALPFWERAYEIARRGPYLPDEQYADWATFRREQVAGMLRQSVQAIARLYLEHHGTAGEEEALRLLRSYWLEYPHEEDVLRPLMELLGRMERFQEALNCYDRLRTLLEEDGHQPDSQTQDIALFLQNKQLTRRAMPTYTLQEVRSMEINDTQESPFSCPLLPSSSTTVDALPIAAEQSNWHEQTQQQETPLFPPIWNVPYLRNPFFTGREEVLTHLYEIFCASKTTIAVTQHALSGLGGIGKTQIALEYAYRYGHKYHAVFWVKADTRENLYADYLSLAGMLHLPEQANRDAAITILAIKQWLRSNSKWLLILDNADDLSLVRAFLPTGHQGHILLTTKAQSLGGLGHAIGVEVMDEETGTLFLLRRARLVAPDVLPSESSDTIQAHSALAKRLVQELGGLPLALDQAGAYIEATGTSLESYLSIYQRHCMDLLQERHGQEGTHPEPVATTWSLSFQHVRERSAIATELLHLCAFLAPDAINEELLQRGEDTLGPSLSALGTDLYLWEKALEALRTYSLITRDPQRKTLALHRLVQSVVRESLPPEEQSEWMRRTVTFFQHIFPFALEVATWAACEALLPHGLLCVQWIERIHLTSPEAASLLDKIGYYLNMRARYEEAKPLFQHALHIREQILEPEHPDIAQTLSNLAYLYHHQDNYEEAMDLLHRSLLIRQRVLGMMHPDTATSLNALALLHRDRGEYKKAESFYQQALSIREQVFGPDHPQTAHSLSNLAWLYRNQGRYEEAEALYRQSLTIRKRVLGIQHPDTATSLNGLALLYAAQKEYSKAEPFYRQALAIRQQILGAKHLHTAQSMNALALLYRSQKAYEKAEPLFQEALAIREQILGSDHPRTITSRNNLALLYRDQGKFELAEPLFRQTFTLREHLFGRDHPQTVASRKNLILCQNRSIRVQALPSHQQREHTEKGFEAFQVGE